MIAFRTLFLKELLRFRKVVLQTVAAPVVMALLYLLVFSQALESHVRVYADVSYTAFLVPGLVMMSVLQNAFANSSSSLIQGKMGGGIFFILITPLSYREFFLAYVLAAVVRGLVVGVGVWLVTAWFAEWHLAAPLWALAFALAGGAIMGALGVIAGIWAEEYDMLAGFQNFLIMPLTFLSGVFYSIHTLPPLWQTVSRFNPAFYLIDGFRYGFFGTSDVSPWLSLAVAMAGLVVLSVLTLRMLMSGYKLRG